jgi:protein O-mannosyl-transferase
MSKKPKAKNEQHHAHGFGWDGIIPTWLSCLLICAVGILVYSNTFQNSFHFDDETSITGNTAIRNLADLKAIWGFSPFRFITYLSFALNYHFGGLDVLGYHIVNILIHILTALTVWQLALRIFRTRALEGERVSKRAPLLALGVALVFVAHPIQTEAVTYIVQRAASLATLFYVLSLTFFLEARIVQSKTRSGWPPVLLFSMSGVAALLALFSKETSVTLPIAMLMIEFFFLREGRGFNWRFILGVLGFFALVVAFLVSRDLISLVDTTAISRGKYLLTQPRVLISYLSLLFVPMGQTLDHFVGVSSSLLESQTFFGVLGLAAFSLLGVWLYPRKRVFSFGIFWFILTLLPESSVIPLKDLMFEHRLYLPMIGFSISLVYLIHLVLGRKKALHSLVAVGTYVALLGSLAFVRNGVWRDEITLWSDVVFKSPMDPRAYHNRGRAYAERNMNSEALRDYGIAISLDPTYGPPHINRASLYIKKQMFDEAIVECNQALRMGEVMQFQTARTYFNRATAYLMKNKIDSAFADFSQTVAYDPTHAAAYLNLGIIYSRRGETQKALESYSRCVSLSPRNARALESRGEILEGMGRADSALADFNRAIAAEPEFPRPYLNRGILLSKRGEFDQAIDNFSLVLKLSPNNFDGYYQRGIAYVAKREFDQGVRELSHALDVNPSFGQAYVDRARAYLGLEQFANAASDLKRAKLFGAAVDKGLEAAIRRGLGR